MTDNECCASDISETQKIFTKIQSKIKELPIEKQNEIQLLRVMNVIKWIFGITTFLEPENPIVSYGFKDVKEETDEVYKSGPRKGQKKIKNMKVEDKNKPKYKYTKGQLLEKRKENEAKWNMELMKKIRPDLFNKEHKQASLFGKFGEILAKEYYILIGEFKTDKPEKLDGHDLDLETLKEMIEVKTGSYFTTGTAGEKNYGVPYKYRKVPRLYNKPLLIIIIGGDKKDSALVCETDDPENEIHKEFWRSQNITFTCFKKLLNNL